MKRVLIAAAAMTVAGVCSTQAADLGARPYYKAAPAAMTTVYDWSGLYLGLNGGGGSSHNCWHLSAYNTGAPASLPEGCHNATGGTFGGQIGYRWQAANWVFGLEGQGNWANFSGSNSNISYPGATDRTRIDSFGLITAQVGYAFDNVLLYVKGGAAAVSNKYDTYRNGPESFANKTQLGGTVGAGLEVGFAQNWSIGVEYNHIFMSDKTVGMTYTAPYKSLTGYNGYTNRNSQDVDMALVRLNYKFGGAVLAKY